MIKGIIFDFWGTLVSNGVWSPIKQVKQKLDINLPFSEYVVRMERALMAEKFPSLKKAFENVFMEFGIEENEDLLNELIGMWNKNWMLAKPYEETEEVLEKLKKNYKLFLISNTDSFSVENIFNKYPLNNFFDRLFLSYQLNMIKTDKNFLKLVIDETGIPTEEMILVGDSMQSDIIMAKKLDIKAILIDRNDSRNYHQKIKNLQELFQHL